MVQGAFDANCSKAVGGKLSLSREGRHTFTFGASAYHDVIPADPGQSGREIEIVATIAGAHFVYRAARLGSLEYFHVRGRGAPDRGASSPTTRPTRWASCTSGSGVLTSASTGWIWTRGTPYYPLLLASVTRALFGLRWDVVGFNALKLEYQRADRSWGVENTVVLQSAFTF